MREDTQRRERRHTKERAQWLAALEQVDEFGNELLGELVRAVDVVAARDDAGQLEGGLVGGDHQLGGGLGGGVRVCGTQRGRFRKPLEMGHKRHDEARSGVSEVKVRGRRKVKLPKSFF